MLTVGFPIFTGLGVPFHSAVLPPNQPSMKSLYTLFMLCTLCLAAFGQDGVLDSTFADNGILAFDLNQKSDTGHGLAIQPDGKILVSMSGSVVNNFDIVVIRLLENGTLDTTFADKGIYAYGSTDFSDLNYGVTLASDGSIFAFGGYGVTAPNTDLVIIKLDSDGVPDPSFGTDGVFLHPYGEGEEYVHALAFTPDGKILFAGNTSVPGFSINSHLVGRLHTDGTIDTSFGDQGFYEWNDVGTTNETWDIELLADGSMLTCGKNVPAGKNRPCLYKLLPDGAGIDSSFAINGFLEAPYEGVAREMVIHPNGRILLAASDLTSMGYNIVVLAFNADGTEDLTFGTDGVVLVDNDINDYAAFIVVQDDGKIIAGGESGGTLFQGNPRGYFTVRMDEDGIIDPSWGGTGMVTTNTSDFFAFANDCAIQADGRVLLTGASATNSGNDCVIVRYNNGTISSTHDPASILLNISPNPATDQLVLDVPAGPARTYTLFHTNGQQVASGILAPNQIRYRIPVDHLASGTYIVVVQGPDGAGRQLLIKH